MNWFYVGGVLVLYAGWIVVGGISEIFPVARPWNLALATVWFLALMALQTLPWTRFARRAGIKRTATHAFVTHLLVGGIAVTAGMMWDRPFPEPIAPCGMPFCYADIGDSTPDTATFAREVLVYASGSAVWASIAGGITLALLGRASPVGTDQLLRFAGRRTRAPRQSL